MNDLALIDKPATPPSACRSLTPSKALRASRTSTPSLVILSSAKVRLGGGQQLIEVLSAFVLAAVGEFLAHDAVCRKRHRRQAFRADVLFARQTDAETSLFDAVERRPDVPQQIGVAVQAADCQLALGGVLHFIESIGTLFDDDSVAIAYQLHQL